MLSGGSWNAAGAAVGDDTPASPPPVIKTRRFSSFKKNDGNGEEGISRLGRSKSLKAARPALSRSHTISGGGDGGGAGGNNQSGNHDNDDNDDDTGTDLRRVKTGWSGKSEGAVSNRSVLMSRLGRGLRLGRRRWS